MLSGAGAGRRRRFRLDLGQLILEQMLRVFEAVRSEKGQNVFLGQGVVGSIGIGIIDRIGIGIRRRIGTGIWRRIWIGIRRI